jgi:hypothetical protein
MNSSRQSGTQTHPRKPPVTANYHCQPTESHPRTHMHKQGGITSPDRNSDTVQTTNRAKGTMSSSGTQDIITGSVPELAPRESLNQR